MNRKIIKTKDGSHTLYQEDLDEHYHSVHGALQESLHVFIEMGLKYFTQKEVTILEVGFGTGLNALLTCLECDKIKRMVNYIALEKYPLEKEILDSVNYTQLMEPHAEQLFQTIHKVSWDQFHPITPFFVLKKNNADFLHHTFTSTFDIIYFDAFAPDKQSEMWTLKNFTKLYGALNQGGILVTYSAKGVIKRRLEEAGFEVQKLPGPPGKREMIRALKR